jgi:molybdopterin/thiamine biosynthesis adenylyltransferase
MTITTAPPNAVDTATQSAVDVIHRTLDTTPLTRGRVVIIGLGGIGLFLARTLVVFLAGLLRPMRRHQQNSEITLVLCDGDAFDVAANAYRMDIPGAGNKAVALGQELIERFDDPGLNVRWHAEYVTEDNVYRIIAPGDCIFLACDNHATRHLVGRRCQETDMIDVVLISGGNDGMEGDLRGTYGNVQVYLRQAGQEVTAPLDRFHPEIASPADQSPADLSCLEAAVAGAAQLVFANMAVASAMCNALLRLMMPIEGEGPYDEISLDILDAVSLPHWLS